MSDNFIRHGFDSVFKVEKLITFFYMEFSKAFSYSGEKHDFWEMVYIDKGEMICTADKNRFTLKSGELTFHKPNEFHNLEGNQVNPTNVSIITFECHSRAMRYFQGKIFKLTPEEKNVLAMLFEEGLSCYEMADRTNPLIQKMTRRPEAPFGSSQMTKNLLEMFLIQLSRNKSSATKAERKSYVIDGVDVPYQIKEILDIMQARLYGRLTVHELAEVLHQSESQVKKMFARYYPGGLIRYYNAMKMKEARRLIREDTMNMTQIAEKLGFDNSQYFSKSFAHFTHMTPTQYKRSVLAEVLWPKR